MRICRPLPSRHSRNEEALFWGGEVGSRMRRVCRAPDTALSNGLGSLQVPEPFISPGEGVGLSRSVVSYNP